MSVRLVPSRYAVSARKQRVVVSEYVVSFEFASTEGGGCRAAVSGWRGTFTY